MGDYVRAGRGYFYEGQDVLLLAQIYTQAGALLATTDVNSNDPVTVKVYDLTKNSTNVVTDSSLTVGQVVFTATTTVGWQEDTIGANFGMRLYDSAVNDAGDPGVVAFLTNTSAGGHRYLVEVTFPTPNFGLAVLTWELQCLALAGR